MQLWHKQADGRLLRTVGPLKMVIHPHPIHGAIRFILIRESPNHPGGSLGAMIASGYKESVGCAMAAVEKMAGRLIATVSSASSSVSHQADLEASR